MGLLFLFPSRIVHAEMGIPVATSAPDGYLDSQFGGLGKVSFKLHLYVDWSFITSINCFCLNVLIIYYSQCLSTVEYWTGCKMVRRRKATFKDLHESCIHSSYTSTPSYYLHNYHSFVPTANVCLVTQ
jgi:hypothetical protein